jgi:hypothetical protein
MTTVQVSPGERTRRTTTVPPAVADVLVAAGWFVVAGVLGALVWWWVTPLPEVTRTGDAVMISADGLVMQVAIDGWFFVVATVGGLLSGAALVAWRSRDPLLMVVLVALGALGAAWLMLTIGVALGPGDETEALRGRPDGSTASMRLELHATGVFWMWPIAATLGALSYLWIAGTPQQEPAPEPS